MKAAYKSRDGRVTLYHADSTDVLLSIAPGSIDLVQTDPPYSSGGLHKGERSRDPLTKYLNHLGPKATRHASFGGDNRDQRSFSFWATQWATLAVRSLKVGGHMQVFTDWRQLPTVTDVVQAGGLLWRGVVPWDKGRGSRAPHTGYFRHQAEYVVWGTKGPAPKCHGRGPFDGVVACGVKSREKLHPTGKPPEMLGELMGPCSPGGVVFDPFMGSGSAGVAALRRGLRFIGVECDAEHYQTAVDRLKAEARNTKGRTPAGAAA